jgi:hypothetical protein
MRVVSAASTVPAHVKLCQSAEWHGTTFAGETNQSGLDHTLAPWIAKRAPALACRCARKQAPDSLGGTMQGTDRVMSVEQQLRLELDAAGNPL